MVVFLDRKKDFEIQKKENSIQKKRQYRTNKDESSGSESDKDKSNDRRVIFLIYMNKLLKILGVPNVFVMTND